MPTFYQFDQNAVQAALDAAKQDFAEGDIQTLTARGAVTKSSERSLLAECVKVVIEDHKVCVDLPLGLGKHCIPVPINIPNGEAGSACLTICTTIGFPTGVKVSVIVAGITVVSETFGKC
ncbi:hypothetical protein [Aurantimonas sp. VKM B-3413]|uniref:hypothetical protein n=1 Tax=Aurantimonas sp. VKM B-3413 TaxID=2779401 RepID=UPI001E5AAF55|nr:hypothetical protein [Aurantimonas sp. VKM B-3413]MCB8837730.1 hypothetical protein [Aurantimonas sp. VKM B-3413]